MKRILSLLLSLITALSFTTIAFAEGLSYDGYEYTSDGTLTNAYEHLYEEYASVPSELAGTPIKRIDDWVYAEGGTVYLETEQGLEAIGESAFEHSTVRTAMLADTVSDIGKRAFARCEKLEEVTLQSNDIIFGEDCFCDTGHIVFFMHCSNEEAYYEKIANAKGDENFVITVWHSYIDDGDGGSICSACGDVVTATGESSIPVFNDVPENSWYNHYVQIACEFGILNGKGDGIFDPQANMTIAEAVKIAACIHMYETDSTAELDPNGNPWYKPYLDYCLYAGIIEEYVSFDWNEPATRAIMAYLFSRADVQVYEINPDVPLTDIPDVNNTTPFAYEILSLYRRGIATGSDALLTFNPGSNVTRAEAAAFITRILCYDMRVDLPKG